MNYIYKSISHSEFKNINIISLTHFFKKMCIVKDINIAYKKMGGV
jgi:hypothetical protein